MMRPEKSEADHRREVVAACRRLSDLGLIGAGEGNVSVRLGPRRLLTTPTGVNKAFLEPHQLVVTDLGGEKIVGWRQPSSELAMHLAVYRARPDAGAAVHAHPPTAVALTLAGIDLSRPLLPEAVTLLGGGVPTARYATPSTRELAEVVAATLGACDACLMERHGAIAVGRSLEEALDRVEAVERVAQVVLRARLAGGNPTPLPDPEVRRLLELSGRSGHR
jgi:L-fuculose-phosphate aldolase